MTSPRGVDHTGPPVAPPPLVTVTADRIPGAAEPDLHRLPFRRPDDDAPARVVLHQVGRRTFQLVEGFRYEGRAGTYQVLPADLPDTDLASIPRTLGWFVSRYGRHTLAALLHDHLVRNGDRLDPPVARHRADEIFRDTLDELGVPYLRARIMWVAVVFATRWTRPLHRPAMLLWLLSAVVGVLVLGFALATGRPFLATVALVAPLPFAVLWGRRELVPGILGGYTLWFVLFPSALNAVFYGVYAVVESAVQRLRLVRPSANMPRPSGPPAYDSR